MSDTNRSRCPISCALDLVGDKWSLLVLRDILFFGKRYYHEFAVSDEGISTNILADRLLKLETNDLLTKQRDSANKKKFIYAPTEKSLDLLPAILEIILWADKHAPNSDAPKSTITKIKKNRAAFIKSIRSQFKD